MRREEDFGVTGLSNVRVDGGKGECFALERGGTFESPEGGGIAVAVVVDFRRGELSAQGCASLVGGVHFEDVEVGRGAQLFAAGEEEGVKNIDKLGAGGHAHLVGMAVENIKCDAGHDCVADGN